MPGWRIALIAARAALAHVMPVPLARGPRRPVRRQPAPARPGTWPPLAALSGPHIAGGCPPLPVSPEVVMISIHTTRRLACVVAGLAGALAALSAASPAALAHYPPPPTGSGGSTQAQTPIH